MLILRKILNILSVIAGLGVLGGGCFVAGEAFVKYEATSAEAGLREKIGELERDKGFLDAEKTRQASRIKELEAAYKASSESLSEIRSFASNIQAKNDELSAALGRQGNCAFVQEQIRATQAQLDAPSFLIFSNSEELRKHENEGRIKLQDRLTNYQQQLGVCNH